MGEASMRKWERHARAFFSDETLSVAEARRRGGRMRLFNRIGKRLAREWGLPRDVPHLSAGYLATIDSAGCEVRPKTEYSIATISAVDLEAAAHV